ncbi:MAG TPA: tellurite resistance TerB family protein [Methylothermaceae bacterium]|nr:tellurite resistance TerB family protein [Methylothermaceae bacterium]
MEAKQLLDQLLQSGKELAEKGKEWVEEKADIPKEGPEREAALSGLAKGAAAGGLLALLLGTKGGRKLAGTAVKLGGLAALGGLAYKTFQSWHGVRSTRPEEPGVPVSQLEGEAAEKRAQVLLKAMIAAAKADGHVDDQERGKILDQAKALGIDQETIQFIEQQLQAPVDAQAIAAEADSRETAAEIYLLSRMIIDVANDQEKQYLQQLAGALGLEQDFLAQLERRATETSTG